MWIRRIASRMWSLRSRTENSSPSISSVWIMQEGSSTMSTLLLTTTSRRIRRSTSCFVFLGLDTNQTLGRRRTPRCGGSGRRSAHADFNASAGRCASVQSRLLHHNQSLRLCLCDFVSWEQIIDESFDYGKIWFSECWMAFSCSLRWYGTILQDTFEWSLWFGDLHLWWRIVCAFRDSDPHSGVQPILHFLESSLTGADASARRWTRETPSIHSNLDYEWSR